MSRSRRFTGQDILWILQGRTREFLEVWFVALQPEEAGVKFVHGETEAAAEGSG
jgi:hypothetical protein